MQTSVFLSSSVFALDLFFNLFGMKGRIYANRNRKKKKFKVKSGHSEPHTRCMYKFDFICQIRIYRTTKFQQADLFNLTTLQGIAPLFSSFIYFCWHEWRDSCVEMMNVNKSVESKKRSVKQTISEGSEASFSGSVLLCRWTLRVQNILRRAAAFEQVRFFSENFSFWLFFSNVGLDEMMQTPETLCARLACGTNVMTVSKIENVLSFSAVAVLDLESSLYEREDLELENRVSNLTRF